MVGLRRSGTSGDQTLHCAAGSDRQLRLSVPRSGEAQSDISAEIVEEGLDGRETCDSIEGSDTCVMLH